MHPFDEEAMLGAGIIALIILVILMSINGLFAGCSGMSGDCRLNEDCNILCKSKGYASGYMATGECVGGECACSYENGTTHFNFWEGLRELQNGNIMIGGKIDADII